MRQNWLEVSVYGQYINLTFNTFFFHCSKYHVVADYISRLESIVRKVKVSTLNLHIVSETKKAVAKVLKMPT